MSLHPHHRASPTPPPQQQSRHCSSLKTPAPSSSWHHRFLIFENAGLRRLTMVMGWRWPIFLLWCFLTTGIDRAHAQLPSTVGFISIDCGIPAGHNYTDSITNIPYISDFGFIDTGNNHNVTSEFTTSSYPQDSTLRSFENAPPRNCYTIKPLKKGLKYLVRASFLYGNYNGNETTSAGPIVFDLHIGVNFWQKINITIASSVYRVEALVVATREFLWVCLVDIGSGTPFISSLEVRQLKEALYPAVNATNPLVLHTRNDTGSQTNSSVRYPDDPYDRIWVPCNFKEWDVISTQESVILTDMFAPPSAVMQTAVVPAASKNNTDIRFYWYSEGDDYEYYKNIHFMEVDPRAQQPKFPRILDEFFNEVLWSANHSPRYSVATVSYSMFPLPHQETYSFSLRKSIGSVLPPIMNALEIFYVMQLPELATSDDDVDAIMAIKVQYGFKRNWMGDPCAPKLYAWDGLNCSSSDSELPRIISLNLSSSGLTGEISGSLANLKAITYLDLSNNSLTGEIPDFLADLPSLKVLNLNYNQLNGSIPSALLTNVNNRQLTLSTDGNPNLCPEGDSCEKKKKKSSVLIIVAASVISVFVVLLVVFGLWRVRRTRKLGSVSSTVMKPHNEDDRQVAVNHDDHCIQPESQVFTFKDLEKITRNFELDIGRGGFGTVYHGYLENGTQVAVKMRSQSSLQGTKEFLSEAHLLTRVHHRNLVSLVGYCKDGSNLALVYEYMDGGSLHKHLRGKHSKGKALDWGERLRISLEAARGLEYLHRGCSPPIVHRDIKTSNILLSQRFEAKLADFGLSKAFLSDEHTHVSTVVGGTLGYLDPEYYKTCQLNEKSDVYSFGVVLLELITGKPAVPEGLDEDHIIQWVRLRLAQGDINDVADSRLRGAYDINSIWKAVDIAMKCTSETSIERPVMTDVVIMLKEGLDLEVVHQGPGDLNSRRFDRGATGVGSFEIAHIGQASVVGGPVAR